MLEAENDLSVGNITFSSQRLRSAALSRNSVVVAGAGGVLTQLDKFTINKVLENCSVCIDVINLCIRK